MAIGLVLDRDRGHTARLGDVRSPPGVLRYSLAWYSTRTSSDTARASDQAKDPMS